MANNGLERMEIRATESEDGFEDGVIFKKEG